MDYRRSHKYSGHLRDVRVFDGASPCSVHVLVPCRLTAVVIQAGFAEAGVSRELHVGKTVSILSISLYILGLGIGPLLVGPLSEVYGRNLVYRVSYATFFLFNWPVAFAPDIGEYYFLILPLPLE